MAGNAPDFDPLRATSAETADMLAGYRDGLAGRSARENASNAYIWAWTTGIFANEVDIEAGRKS